MRKSRALRIAAASCDAAAGGLHQPDDLGDQELLAVFRKWWSKVCAASAVCERGYPREPDDRSLDAGGAECSGREAAARAGGRGSIYVERAD